MRLFNYSFVFVIIMMVIMPLRFNRNVGVTSSVYTWHKAGTGSFVPIEEAQYVLHKDMIDTEIQMLKEKYPVLTYDYLSYKFLYAPQQGVKQFFESDGSPFVVVKIYSRKSKPGDQITISAIKYKDPQDSTNTWKNFETNLLFVFE